MKFQTFALFSAGLLTAAFLSACQRTGDKTTVKDGRDPSRVNKPQQDLSKIGAIQCDGDIEIAGQNYPVDAKLIVWDGKSVVTQSLLREIDEKAGQPLVTLQVIPGRTNSPATMMIAANNIDTDKSIVATGTVQNKVQLTFSHKGASVTKVNVLCAPQNNVQAETIILDKDKKRTEVVCQGKIGKIGEEKSLHDEKQIRVLVGSKDNDAINFEKLNLDKVFVNAKMSMETKLSDDLKSGEAKVKLASEDGKLEVLALAKSDIALTLSIIAGNEKLNMAYGCIRSTLVGLTPLEADVDSTTAGDTRDADATTVPAPVVDSETSESEISPVQKEEIKID